MSDSITVVIPARNNARSILATLTSVEWQSIVVDRVIVVDDGSTDATRSVVSSFASASHLRIDLLDGAGAGAGAARNIGINAADTDLIAFLDADDVWYPDKLYEQLRLISDGIAVGALMHYITPRGALLGTNNRFDSYATANAALHDGLVMPLALSSWLLSANSLLEAGGFDESFLRAQDFELAVRLRRRGMTFVWPEGKALLGYVIHAGGVSATSYREQFLAAELVRQRLSDASLVYEDFVAGRELSVKFKRKLMSGTFYRRAAVKAGEANWAGLALNGVLAVLFDPAAVAGKLRWRNRRQADLHPSRPPAAVRRLLDTP